MLTRFTGLSVLAVLAATGVITACGGGDEADRGDTTTAAGAMADTGGMRGDSGMMAAGDTAGATGAKWSDAQILGYTTAANNDEIAEGKLAQTKATNAEVKAFARQLVTDHQALLREGQAFAKQNNVTPDTTTGDAADMAKDAREELKEMTEKAKGADWDKEFLDEQIDEHKDVLSHLQDAAKNTSDTTLRKMLTKASGKVQEHLTKAQALKDKQPTS
jgi:putative membrane protein